MVSYPHFFRRNQKNTKFLMIAREAYSEQKYFKTIVNYGWAYPTGIESMPVDDFTKYIEAVYFTKDYRKVFIYSENYKLNNDLLVYNLLSYYKVSDYKNVIELYKNNKKILNIKHKMMQKLYMAIVISFRKLGFIDKAIKLVDKNILEYIAELYELKRDLKIANKVWNIIISKYSDEMPSYSWDR